MAELNFDATKYQTENRDEVAALDPAHPRVWETKPNDPAEDPHAVYKAQYEAYLLACEQRREAIAAANREWREAVEASHEAKMNVTRKKHAFNDAKALPAPIAPVKWF